MISFVEMKLTSRYAHEKINTFSPLYHLIALMLKR